MPSGSSEPLSDSDLRAKRLAALGIAHSSSSTAGTATATATATASSNSLDTSTAENTNAKQRAHPMASTGKSMGGTIQSTAAVVVDDCDVEGILPAFQDLMWDPNTTSESDQQRWFDQGIYTFAMVTKSMDVDDDEEEKESSEMRDDSQRQRQRQRHAQIDNWGISQTHGGPCGVLAVIQAEMIKFLELYDNLDRQVSSQEADRALCEALGAILARCSTAPSVQADHNNGPTGRNNARRGVKLVLPFAEDMAPSMIDFGCNNAKLKCTLIQANECSQDEDGTRTPESKRCKAGEGTSSCLDRSGQEDTNAQNLATATAEHLFENNLLRFFQRPGGVILLALSMMQTRGAACIKRDMDDPTAKLTAQFGYSSQEFINLLLTGQATSNTFDDMMTLGGGALKCHGVQSQPSIGYLTQLEALRYCSVGSYYKTPRCPIWLVGSTSHFTVLFGPRESLEESMSDVILQRCRRAFKSIEGAEDNGFIAVTDLEGILKKLDLDLGTGVQTLGAAIEMSGAGIILWADFWKSTSRLLTGASLESVLQTCGVDNVETSGAISPLALTQFGENSGPAAAASISNTGVASQANIESDEEMARRLAAEWGSQDLGSGGQAQSHTSQNFKSDEELARELQAKFAEDDGFIPVIDHQLNDVNTIAAVGDASSHSGSEDLEIATINAHVNDNGFVAPRFDTAITIEESARESQNANFNHVNMEKLKDNSFPMYHYNSLRGGILTTFHVTRLSAEEAVGKSVALSETSTDSGIISGSIMNGGDSMDLETVVRTKYPSCKFDWGGKIPPSLH